MTSLAPEFADVLPGLAQRHDRLREVRSDLNEEILGSLDPSTFRRAMEMLDVMPGKMVIAGVDIGMALVPEFSMYGVFAEGENAVQRFRRTHPQTDPERQMLLDAMSQAIFTLVGVVETYPAEHALVVEDLFLNNQRMLLADSTFAADAPAEDVMCIRMHPMGKFWMSTGLGLSLGIDTKHPQLLTYVATASPRSVRSDPDRQDILHGIYASVVIKRLLRRHSQDTEFTDDIPEERNNEHLLSERLERNAPCPCGSGKKYKKCCGR